MSTSLRVGLVTEAFFDLPFWAGVDRGTYAEAGLEVENVVLGGIDAVTAALLAGELDIAVGSPEHVITDVERGGPLRMVAGNVNRLTHSLIVQPDITRLEDLRGRVLGVSAFSAGTSSLWRSILTGVGLHYPDDYRVVEAGAVPPRHELLLAGTIDAAMQTDPHNYLAEDAGLTDLGPVLDLVPYYQFTAVGVRADWADAHAEALTAFLAASIRATEWMFDDRDGAIELAGRHMPIERRYLERAWDDHVVTDAVPRDLRLLRASLETTASTMHEFRDEAEGMDPAEAAKRCVEPRYLAAAQRRLGLPEVPVG